MRKRLTRTGNSLALVLDKAFLEAAHVEPDMELEVSTDGEVIVITPVRDENRAAKFREGVEQMHRMYAGVFAKLAE